MPRSMILLLTPSLLLAVTALPAFSQSIQTDGNIETDAQLVSKVARGTAPLAVSSSTLVPSLNADRVDNLHATQLALDTDLQSVEAMLLALQAQVDALGLALVSRTGQTTCYDAAGVVVACGTGIGLAQDGDLQLGVTWPNPRFTDNGDGTVTDNLTGLIWLDDANCFGAKNWADALAAANGLFDGSTNDSGGGDCGLSDGSSQGAWRLPNVRELQSLVHFGVFSPAVPNTAGTGQWTPDDPFSSVQSFYWSSTTVASNTVAAWAVTIGTGFLDAVNKAGLTRDVWPVRRGR